MLEGSHALAEEAIKKKSFNDRRNSVRFGGAMRAFGNLGAALDIGESCTSRGSTVGVVDWPGRFCKCPGVALKNVGNFGSYASLVRLQQFWNHPGNAHAQLEVLVWRRRRCLGACFELFRSFWKRLGCVWG